MEQEINDAWEQCRTCDESEYVKAFREVNEEKALLNAKKIIDETEKVSYVNVQDSYFYYLRHDTIIHMFASSEKKQPLVIERKETWLRDHICKHAYDETKMKDVFNVIVTTLPDKRIKFIKLFLEQNSSFIMFEKLSLFSSSRSWSGSEIPLIERDINFLQSLLDELSGVDYLEHRMHIKERISKKRQYKQEVLKREYMENFAYV